ncbi:hypothetical protein TeGR_g9173, partial [Tetraparma gracilis]
IVPAIATTFLGHGVVCAGEGILLGATDLKFLSWFYGAFFVVMPTAMLQIKWKVLRGVSQGPVNTWLSVLNELRSRQESQQEIVMDVSSAEWLDTQAADVFDGAPDASAVSPGAVVRVAENLCDETDLAGAVGSFLTRESLPGDVAPAPQREELGRGGLDPVLSSILQDMDAMGRVSAGAAAEQGPSAKGASVEGTSVAGLGPSV